MINLFINPYEEKDPERRAELDYCIGQNYANGIIGKVYELDGRPTYQDFFNKINEHTIPEDVNVIANLDIFFDSTLINAAVIHESECFALSRWDVTSMNPTSIKMYQQAGSQDAWIFKGHIRPIHFSGFPIGKLGCDNRLAHELQQAKYRVLNPCKSIRAIHYHLSGKHNYNPRNTNDIVAGPYAFVRACFLDRIITE